jgi:hypothetical protein
MLSTAAAPSTSLAAAVPTSRACHRRTRGGVIVAAAPASGTREGGAERFATSSSITDYLWYRRPEFGGGAGGGRGGVAGGELQTAVVRFEKRFPWSLLHPFLHVSLLLLLLSRSRLPDCFRTQGGIGFVDAMIIH